MKHRRPLILASVAILVISSIVNGVVGHGGNAKNITLSYVAWDSEIASTHVVKQVLEQRLGYQVNMLQVEAGPMWTGVATKSADALVAAWLPKTHASFYAKNKDHVEDLGANLEGTRLGLVVPEYMNITSIQDLRRSDIKDATKATIIGIEPGAGLMSAATKMLQDYQLTDWTLMEASSAAMATELQKAYSQQKPIVITGWTPHWMFAKMKLKYLDDPKNSFGEDEQIHTIVRLGLQGDLPDAYQFLRQFKWTPDDMAQVMVRIQEGIEPDDAANEWISAHPDIVEKWLAGIELKK
ncbi:glycine betaine ABC transporter substrate-binding protein [Brevibacillus laterosporus]|nr:glycine betaine ABC transporter substrate-binding protein [Brevibacillus laterosporus]MCZ0842627.1 glycine betaine ABC transporter substrate-binding protein [Brevibacillus laterosporus]MCZ0846554.1 glycine betaine ABC transporter substrate-binding protein [Brevibacillus laterosporus]